MIIYIPIEKIFEKEIAIIRSLCILGWKISRLIIGSP